MHNFSVGIGSKRASISRKSNVGLTIRKSAEEDYFLDIIKAKGFAKVSKHSDSSLSSKSKESNCSNAILLT